MGELGLWCDGTNMVVALDEADASKVYEENTGEAWSEEEQGGAWSKIDDGREIKIGYENASDVPAGSPFMKGRSGILSVNHTAAEWVAINGRGTLGSTEY